MQSVSFLHSLRIILALGWADFVLKYRGSFLGYLWSFIVPLVKFLVILHIFRPFTSHISFYPLYLFFGILLWEHFAMTTSACISMPYDKESIIKKMPLPRILLIFAIGWTHCIILSTYILMFLLFSVAMGVVISISAAFYILLLFIQSTFLSLGVGMILGSYSLKFRDVPHIWGVLLQILFWLTPVMYAFQPNAPILSDVRNLVSGGMFLNIWNVLDSIIRFQPLTLIMHDARRVLLYSQTLGMPTMTHSFLLTLLLAILCMIGVFIFLRRSPYFIQEY